MQAIITIIIRQACLAGAAQGTYRQVRGELVLKHCWSVLDGCAVVLGGEWVWLAGLVVFANRQRGNKKPFSLSL